MGTFWLKKRATGQGKPLGSGGNKSSYIHKGERKNFSKT